MAIRTERNNVNPGILRTLLEAVITAFFTGAAIGTTVVLNSGHGGGPPPLLEAVTIGVLASVFVSIPLGVVGGALMAWVMRRERRPRTRSAWVGTGLVMGAAIGGIGSAAISAGFNGFHEFATLFFSATGGLAGAIAGVVLGLWCARQTGATR
jgi:hypothetical protein